MSSNTHRIDVRSHVANARAELNYHNRNNENKGRKRINRSAKERFTPEEFLQRKLIKQLIRAQEKAARLRKKATPAEIRFAEQNYDKPETVVAAKLSSESGHIRADLAVRLMLIFLAIWLLTSSLTGCSNNVEPGTPAPTAVAAEVIDAPVEEAPTDEPKPTPVAAPEAATVEAPEDNVPVDPISDPVEDEPSIDVSPEAEGTEVPVQEIIEAAAEQGVELTPEAIAEFDIQTVDGKIRLRKTADHVEIIVTPEGQSVEFIVVESGTIEESDEKIDVKDENGRVVYSIVRATSVMTETPEPVVIPTPETNPAENIDLAQTAVGPEIVVDHLGNINLPLVEDKNNENPTTKAYTVAYDSNGIIVARFSNENGGDPEWIAGGPFSNSELNGGSSNFPCAVNGFNYCGVQIRVSQYLEFGSFDSGNAIRLLNPVTGEPTDYYMEDGTIGYFLDETKQQQVALYPTLIFNAVTGQRMNMDNFHEDPAPNWQFSDFLLRRSELYFLTHFDETLFDNPRNDATNYWLNSGAIRPTLGPLDILIMSFPFPGRTPSGGDEITGNYDFLSPLNSGIYSGDAYQSFMQSGKLSQLPTKNSYNGIPIYVPNNGITWQQDAARQTLE